MQIAIISGKGGTGKSSISAAFATLSNETVLADCDVDAANLYQIFNPFCDKEYRFISGQKAVIDYNECISCGKCIDICRFDAIKEKDGIVIINEILCDGCKLCSRICPVEAIKIIDEDKSRMFSGYFQYGRMVYGLLAPGEENSGRLVNMVRENALLIAKESNFNTIIIDGPPGIGCPAISSVTGVDKVIIVTEPTLSGLHDLKRTIEIIENFNLKMSVIINKYDLNKSMSDKIETFCISKKISVIALLPFDKAVVEAMVNCKSITEWAPESEISIKIKEAYSLITKQ